jgi:hypothetical protein
VRSPWPFAVPELAPDLANGTGRLVLDGERRAIRNVRYSRAKVIDMIFFIEGGASSRPI